MVSHFMKIATKTIVTRETTVVDTEPKSVSIVTHVFFVLSSRYYGNPTIILKHSYIYDDESQSLLNLYRKLC